MQGFWSAAAINRMADIAEIAREIEDGKDLSHRLSNKVIPKRRQVRRHQGKPQKDFALNAYDVHHLHLGERDQNDKWKHADNLLFVRFGRFDAVMLFLGSHKSFEDGSVERSITRLHVETGFTIKGVMPPREPPSDATLHLVARRGYSTSGSIEAAVVPLAMQMSNGHSLRGTNLAQRIGRIVEQVDPQVEDLAAVHKYFGEHAHRLSASPVFEWHMNHLDLALVETVSGTAGIFLTAYR